MHTPTHDSRPHIVTLIFTIPTEKSRANITLLNFAFLKNALVATSLPWPKHIKRDHKLNQTHTESPYK
jgi:hypothetical protein